jgi:lactoylglutathione lyase
MNIEHIAIWVKDLELMKNFYCEYFSGVSNDLYVNDENMFSSYFISFEGGARLELMSMPVLERAIAPQFQSIGFAHFAVSTGSTDSVDRLTRRLVADGFELVDGPRWTGDGYYESTIFDPEGNRIEITI